MSTVLEQECSGEFRWFHLEVPREKRANGYKEAATMVLAQPHVSTFPLSCMLQTVFKPSSVESSPCDIWFSWV